MPRLGEAVEPSRVREVDPWWRALGATERSVPAANVEQADEEEPPSVTEGLAWPLD